MLRDNLFFHGHCNAYACDIVFTVFRYRLICISIYSLTNLERMVTQTMENSMEDSQRQSQEDIKKWVYSF